MLILLTVIASALALYAAGILLFNGMVMVAVLAFAVGTHKGNRITGTVLGPAVAGLSALFGGKSAADGGKFHPLKLATETTTTKPTKPETSTPELQKHLDKLNAGGKKMLDSLTHAGRGRLLRECLETIMQAGPDLVTETIKYKGSYEPGRGEETLGWAGTAGMCRQLAESFECLAKGKYQEPVCVEDHPSGRKVATVFPMGFYEAGLFGGYNGELWFPPGEEPQREKIDEKKARLFFLLGAGNQATVVSCDVLNIIFRENAVCLCKLNPVNDYLKPHLEKALAPLIKIGLLVFVNGGQEASEFLVNHDLVQGLHLTGSDKTYDAIMWGPGAKKEGTPKLSKQFTAELGCCTPFIITPGEWSAASIDLHSRQAVATCVHNAHFNCLATQLIVVDSKWPQRQEFMKAMGRHMKAAYPRTAYYPGAKDRADKFIEAYKGHVTAQGKEAEGAVPWTLITGADANKDDYACKNEAFTGVVTEVALDTDGSPEAFLKAATKYCNEDAWGTLSCSIFLPPDTLKSCPQACEQAIADLKYGSVCINVPSIMGYFVPKCTWGGYRGHTPQDIQSGIGNIHNALLYKNVEKSVVRGPWKQSITPFWCHDNANIEAMAPWIGKQLASESLQNWTMCAIHAVQG